ncbi:MAG: hypothetical protein CL534_05660 [Ahrensia sp.]|nr:hypothetical protein [Ahrensia sp.]
MPSAVDNYPIVRFAANGYRLIPSRFPPVSVYRDLVAPEQFEALVEVENKTNPRLRLQERLVARREGPTLDSALMQNWNLAPFTYENPEGTTFFAPERSCLELADTPQTALAVSVARRSRFLSRTKEAATGLDMRMLKTPIDGRFIDLRQISVELPQEQRWSLGDAVPLDVDGILFRPAERPTATAIAVLKGQVLGRSIQTTHYRFEWNGVRIDRLYAFDEEGTVLRPESLAGKEEVLAA